MKRLIVCCDGTWQRASQDHPTNVALIAQAVGARDADGTPQIVFYDSGVGAEFDLDDDGLLERLATFVRRKVQGGTGSGLERKIYEAYRFLALNWEPGDAIFLFGFSRGAFTVRSLAGLIYCSGLLPRTRLSLLGQAYALYRDPDVKPSDIPASRFRERHAAEPEIAFLGCFDTVGMLGVPDLSGDVDFDERLNREHRFHDTQVSRAVLRARQACAVDEPRKAFPLTPMTASKHAPDPARQVVQRWFAGPHGAVGGGEAAHDGLADIALDWMAREAEAAGLALDRGFLDGRLRPDPHAQFEAPGGFLGLLGSAPRTLGERPSLSDLHDSVVARWRADPAYRPETLAPLAAALDAGAA